MAEGGWDAFVSYGHGDAAWVRVLAANLHRAGFDVFLDEWELVGGDRVTGRLEEAIHKSVNGVLVVSPHALARPWVREEYEALLRQAVQEPGRRLIPVLYADAELPVFLANRLWVDFRGAGTTGPQYETRLGELVRALKGLPAADRPARDGTVELPGGAGGEVVRPAGALRAELRLSAAEVSLTAGADPVSQVPRGLRRSTLDAVRAVEWRRAHPDPAAAPGDDDAALAEVGRRLSEDFLTGPAGATLAARVAEATGLNDVLELGLEVAGPTLTDLPWEALQAPEASGEIVGAGGSPLVLHRNVALYRLIGGLGAAPAHKVRGPLRLLVAIASPETAEAELLDYEAELARIVAAVEPARTRGQGGAYVRVLNEGSPAAIHAALSEDPEGFHVLHLSCHAGPGELLLETADGRPDLVTARRLLEEGVPAGADLPMVLLSGCSTGLAARQERLHPGAATQASPAGASTDPDSPRLKQDGEGEEQDGAGEAVLASFAAELVAAGVPMVLAMQAPVTDRYATALSAELYRRLATGATPDPLLALAEARRAAERDRQALPPGSRLRGPAEWATPALTTRALRLPLFNPREPPGPVQPPQAPVLADGVVVREVGDFVGRRQETRAARRVLAGDKAGLLLHGIGGVGKSTLAAEVLRSVGENAGLVVSRVGTVSVDDVLGEIGARLHQAASATEGGEGLARAGLMLRAADVEWAERWRLLAEQVLPAVPMTVLLDNFEDNLTEAQDGGWQVRDPELAAFLAGWARRPGRGRLLFTSRHPFALPKSAERRLAPLHLGPLSAAETRKLIWRLPGLDALTPEEKNRAYRDVGGHPRTLEYLDALLRGGRARFDDVAERMEGRLRDRGIADPAAWLARPGRDLDASLAEAVTLSVDDILLSGLLDRLSATALAAEVLIGAAVYRIPVDDTALVFQVGQPVKPSSDPERVARISRVQQAIEAAERPGDGKISLEDAGLSEEEYARYQADVAEELRPPMEAPDSLAAAVAAARNAGLLVPVPAQDEDPRHFVHRWTAGAIAALHPDATRQAHQQAAAFWRWRVRTIPQSREDAIDQLLEARYHHHAGGEAVEAMAAHMEAVNYLQTWGQYGRAAELCRETLTWLAPDSPEAAVTEGTLGTLAQLRGDYDSAERSHRHVLEIFTRLGDQKNMAASYHQLGRLAELRGDYDAAEPLYRRALDILERIGDQAGMSASYRQLGILAQHRGDYDTAEPLYRRALDIKEQIGDQPGTASSYHQLGMLAQDRGDYDTAEPLYRRALDISERIGDQAGMASGYHQLAMLAQDRGDYDTAESLYRRALDIFERIGDQADAARSYGQLGRLAQLRGDYDTAESLHRRALDIRERIGDQAGTASSYHQLGILAHLQDHYDTTEPLYRRALDIFERIGDQAGTAASHHQLGTLAQDRGDYDTAEPLHRRALDINERIGNQADAATSYAALGA
jgi:tetratricopeptide (TPR) repeat protein